MNVRRCVVGNCRSRLPHRTPTSLSTIAQSYRTMTAFDQDLLRRKDEKLPLAILIHFNYYLSLVFALLIGRLVLEKHWNYHFCNSFQRSLLVPAYCTWLVAEIPRLYVGMKGVLRDKLPEMAAFILLSFFPQVWIAMYVSFFQEIILPVDALLGMMMIAFIVAETALAWIFLRSIISRQSALYCRIPIDISHRGG